MNRSQQSMREEACVTKLDIALESRSQSGRIVRCPVHDEGFTIGTSLSCDLVLLEDGLQQEHAIIRHEKGALWIQCIDPEDVVLVNAKPFHWLALRDGDTLTFGTQEFCVRVRVVNDFGSLSVNSTKYVASPEEIAPATAAMQTGDCEDLSFLSTEELVARLETEMALVEEFESRREAGVNALWRAIQETDGAANQIPPNSETRAA